MGLAHRLQGKVALITGAGRGMGASHARGFVAEGARVILTDILEEAGQALASELGDSAIFLKHDVSDVEAWKRIVDAGEERFGPINVLVNNAAVSLEAPVAEMSLETYRRSVDINQAAVFVGMQAVYPSMLRAGSGSIINISSLAGMVGGPNAIAYSATKFAVRGMTKVAAIEWGKDRIRVNSVHPGAIRTPMLMDHPNYDIVKKYGETCPLGRMAEPEEITPLIIYLASDESSFCTGAEFIIDGGATAV